MYQKITFYPIHYSLLIYPQLILLWSVLDGQTDRENFHPLFPKSFFSLGVRGPTCRRNSTRLAKRWGGWTIEQVCVVPKSAGFSIHRFKTLGPPWGQMLPGVGRWVA